MRRKGSVGCTWGREPCSSRSFMAGVMSVAAAPEPRTSPASSAWARPPKSPPPVAQSGDAGDFSVLEQLDAVEVNSASAPRVPNTANIRFNYIEGEALVIALDLKGVAVSTGAACSSGAIEPSHVLTAIGLTPDQARASLRFSLGKQNTTEDVDLLLSVLPATVAHLRKLSPVYNRK